VRDALRDPGLGIGERAVEVEEDGATDHTGTLSA
jgi:hypothetical protein